MPDLPVELWDHIANLTDRKELYALALVSRSLLDSCRRNLFGYLFLDHRSPRDYNEMFAFLVQTNLAACIRILHVANLDQEVLTVGIPFERMVNLQCLSISYWERQFFMTPEFQQDLVRQLERCHNLREFRYMEHTMGAGEEASPPHDELAIAGLRSLNWNNNGKLRPAFFSLCAASFSTVQVLHVHTTMQLSEHEQYSRLFNLKFPILENLQIGPGNRSICLPNHVRQQLARGFSNFLIAHPTIKNLTLDYFDDKDIEAYLPFDERLLASGVLPNLEALEAYPLQVTQFASVKAGFLRTLASLVIRESSFGDIKGALSDTFVAIQGMKNSVGPLGLRHLVLALNNRRHDCQQLCKAWFDTCADAFPLLETYKGETFRSPAMYGQFPHFQHLRMLSCGVKDKKWRSQHAQAIAQHCPLLEKIAWRPKRIFNVDRDLSTGEVTVRVSSSGDEDVQTEDETADNEGVLPDIQDPDLDGFESDSDSDWEFALFEFS